MGVSRLRKLEYGYFDARHEGPKELESPNVRVLRITRRRLTLTEFNLVHTEWQIPPIYNVPLTHQVPVLRSVDGKRQACGCAGD